MEGTGCTPPCPSWDGSMTAGYLSVCLYPLSFVCHPSIVDPSSTSLSSVFLSTIFYLYLSSVSSLCIHQSFLSLPVLCVEGSGVWLPLDTVEKQVSRAIPGPAPPAPP